MQELVTSLHERRRAQSCFQVFQVSHENMGRKLEDLASEDNSTGLRGTVRSLEDWTKWSRSIRVHLKSWSMCPTKVLNVTGNGVFIDVNCEAR